MAVEKSETQYLFAYDINTKRDNFLWTDLLAINQTISTSVN